MLVLIYESAYSTLMLITPFVCYLPQYRLMIKNKRVGSFSKLICYSFIIANLLKLIFWIGSHYNLFILLQSLVLIGIQLLILNKYLEIQHHNNKLDFDKKAYMRAYRLPTEIPYISLSRIAAFFVYYLLIFNFLQDKLFIRVTGGLTSFIETVTIVPQIVNNFRMQSVDSLR